MFSPTTVKDEWPLSQWALLPLLLPTLPEPHRSQACLLASWTHIQLSARPRGGTRCPGLNRDVEPAVQERSFGFRKWRVSCCGGEMEASPNRASRVSVLSERAGHDGSVRRSLQQRQQSRLHVHPLCTERQVRHLKTSTLFSLSGLWCFLDLSFSGLLPFLSL